MAYWELFLSAFISATLAPGGSEAVLAYLIATEREPIDHLLVVATLGNTLGALTTWGLGYLAAKKFPVTDNFSRQHQKALNLIQTYGIWTLLLSWLPMIGDALCFIAGWLKLSFWPGLGLILLGKLGRYTVVALLTVQLKNHFF